MRISTQQNGFINYFQKCFVLFQAELSYYEEGIISILARTPASGYAYGENINLQISVNNTCNFPIYHFIISIRRVSVQTANFFRQWEINLPYFFHSKPNIEGLQAVNIEKLIIQLCENEVWVGNVRRISIKVFQFWVLKFQPWFHQQTLKRAISSKLNTSFR